MSCATVTKEELTDEQKLRMTKPKAMKIKEGRALITLGSDGKLGFYKAFIMDITGEEATITPTASFRMSKEAFNAWYERNKEKLITAVRKVTY